MTRREFFEMIKTMMADMADFEKYATDPIRDEVFAFAEGEIEKMNARNAKRADKPSKKSIENEPIKAKIADFLADKEHTVASEIASGLELTVQKVSALCRQMVNDGILTVTEVKVKGKGTQKAYKVA